MGGWYSLDSLEGDLSATSPQTPTVKEELEMEETEDPAKKRGGYKKQS